MAKGIQRWSSYKYWSKPIPRNRRSLGNICLSSPKLRSVHTTAGQPQESMHHLFFKLSITAVSYPCIVSICETSLEGLRSAPSDTRHTSQLQYVSTQPVSHQGCIQNKHAPIQYHQALARFIIIRSTPSPVLDTSSQPSQAILSDHVIPEPRSRDTRAGASHFMGEEWKNTLEAHTARNWQSWGSIHVLQM